MVKNVRVGLFLRLNYIHTKKGNSMQVTQEVIVVVGGKQKDILSYQGKGKVLLEWDIHGDG